MMDARELKFDVDYMVKVDTYLFPKGTIVRRRLSDVDDEYGVRFICGNKVWYLRPADVEEIPQFHPLLKPWMTLRYPQVIPPMSPKVIHGSPVTTN